VADPGERTPPRYVPNFVSVATMEGYNRGMYGAHVKGSVGLRELESGNLTGTA
jgi:hypothetical protein